mgnify:CR=1 FL=1
MQRMNKREAQSISYDFVAFLLNECDKQGISMYQIARDTCLSYTSILDIKKGKQMPSLYTLCIIADYLGYKFDLIKK